MSGKLYTEEFKIEAVKQETDRGYKIGEVTERLGVTQKILHDWVKKYGDCGSQHQTITEQQEEMQRLKSKLRRVTEERYILKEAVVDSIGQCNTPINYLFWNFKFECLSRPSFISLSKNLGFPVSADIDMFS